MKIETMNKEPRLEFAFINRSVDSNIIQQRLLDGYINATSLCYAANKRFNDYKKIKTTQKFIEALSRRTKIDESILIQSIIGGTPELQGTWVHPKVAINLAQWADPEFAVDVAEWVFEWMQGNYSNQTNLPYHLQRYLLNRNKIPPSHFSVFNEIVISLIAPLEEEGYTLPDKLVPDISEGRVFADWLRKRKNIDPAKFPTYSHEYADGRIVQARLYPNELLPEFREHFNEKWLMDHALKYFKKRDTTALPYLQKIVQSLPYPQRTELEDYIIEESTTKRALGQLDLGIDIIKKDSKKKKG